MRRTGGWIVEHLSGFRIVGVVVAGLILVFGGNITGWSLLVIVIVLAVYLGLLQLIAAWARKVAGAGAGSDGDGGGGVGGDDTGIGSSGPDAGATVASGTA